MTTPDIDELSRARRSAHPNGTKRMYDDDPNYEDRIGLAGELHFARAFGFKIDERILPKGDGRIDFSVRLPNRKERLTIDVKTSPHYDTVLFVKPREIKQGADIFVLCRYFHGHVKMLGWETRAVMSLMPVGCFSKEKGINSHWRAHEQLRRMDQLAELLAMRLPDDEEVKRKQPQTDEEPQQAEPMDEGATYDDDDTQT